MTLASSATKLLEGGVASVVTFLQVRGGKRQKIRPIADSEAVELGSTANTMIRIVSHDFSYVAISKSVMNFSAAFKKQHDMSFLAVVITATMDHIV